MDYTKRPSVGTAVFVLNSEGKFLLGKRKSDFGGETWCIPGGHLEFGESFEECGQRETLEETNIHITNIQFLGIGNDVLGGKHYVTIFMKAEYESGDIIPQFDEFEEVIWTDISGLPQPLFPIFGSFIQKHPEILSVI